MLHAGRRIGSGPPWGGTADQQVVRRYATQRVETKRNGTIRTLTSSPSQAPSVGCDQMLRHEMVIGAVKLPCCAVVTPVSVLE